MTEWGREGDIGFCDGVLMEAMDGVVGGSGRGQCSIMRQAALRQCDYETDLEAGVAG